MAVPKKRHSKQKTKHRRSTWAKGAFQKGAQALSTFIRDKREKPHQKPFEGFDKLSETTVVDTVQEE